MHVKICQSIQYNQQQNEEKFRQGSLASVNTKMLRIAYQILHFD